MARQRKREDKLAEKKRRKLEKQMGGTSDLESEDSEIESEDSPAESGDAPVESGDAPVQSEDGTSSTD